MPCAVRRAGRQGVGRVPTEGPGPPRPGGWRRCECFAHRLFRSRDTGTAFLPSLDGLGSVALSEPTADGRATRPVTGTLSATSRARDALSPPSP